MIAGGFHILFFILNLHILFIIRSYSSISYYGCSLLASLYSFTVSRSVLNVPPPSSFIIPGFMSAAVPTVLTDTRSCSVELLFLSFVFCANLIANLDLPLYHHWMLQVLCRWVMTTLMLFLRWNQLFGSRSRSAIGKLWMSQHLQIIFMFCGVRSVVVKIFSDYGKDKLAKYLVAFSDTRSSVNL